MRAKLMSLTRTFRSCQLLLLNSSINGKGNSHGKDRQHSIQKGGKTVNIVSDTDTYPTDYRS